MPHSLPSGPKAPSHRREPTVDGDATGPTDRVKVGRLDRLIGMLGNDRRGLAAFAVLGFLENTVVALPTEPFYLPLMAAHPRRAGWMALALLVGCILGALAFYAVAAIAFEEAIAPILAALDLTEAMDRQAARLEAAAFETLLLIGVTPIPFQLGTLGAGLVGVGLPTFLAAVTLSRAIRYGALALLAAAVGHRARPLIERHRVAMVVGATAVGVAAVVGMAVLG